MTHTSGPVSGSLMEGMDVFNRLGYSLLAYVPATMVRWSIQAAVTAGKILLLPMMRSMCASHL